MNTQLATHAETRTGHAARALCVLALGPATALAGVVWALAQPWRITLLDPAGRGFWALAVEPPLLVALVGALFHLLVARSLVEDLEPER